MGGKILKVLLKNKKLSIPPAVDVNYCDSSSSYYASKFHNYAFYYNRKRSYCNY